MKASKTHPRMLIKKASAIVFTAFLAANQVLAAQCQVKSSKGSFSVNLNELMNCAEERYGYDKNVLRRSSQKEQAPEVSIFFDKTSPKEGEKITATAVPKGFTTTPEELYYTWYILHTDDNGKVIDTDNGGNLSDEIENGKREAMGKVARGSFDPILFGIPVSDYKRNSDEDNDGFIAPYGGLSGVGAKSVGHNEYQDDEDGDGILDKEDNCEDVYNPEQDDQDHDGQGDWCDDDLDGDEVENDNDNCPSTINENQTDSDSDGMGDVCDDNNSVDNDSDDDGVANEQDNCPFVPNPEQRDLDGDGIGSECDSEEEVGGSRGISGRWEQFDKTGVVKTASITRCYRHNFGTKSDIENSEAVTDTTTDNAGIKRDRAGRDLIIDCQHVFPNYDKNMQWEYEGEQLCTNIDGMKVGDGKFTGEEEACWRLNPNNPDTDGDGVEDEADIAGLNQQHFSWNYRPGDRVGVMVEGTSMIPTNENTLNSYYKIMWASPGICSSSDMDFLKNDSCDNSSGIGDLGFNYYNTLEVDKQADANLDSSLSSSPENPQFDFYEPENSDTVTVSSVISKEPVDQRYVYYDWSIYRCGANFENCITDKVYSDVENDLKDENKAKETSVFLTSDCQAGMEQDLDDCGIEVDKPLAGMGIDTIDFRPRKELMIGSKEYFKVVLKTKRNQSDPNYAVSDIIIPVTQNDLQMNFYTVTKGSSSKYTNDEAICQDGLYKRMCPVYPNQILAAEVIPRNQDDNDYDVQSYAWQLNGQPLYPPYQCAFDKCEMGNTVYFPITGDKLFVGNLSVTAKRSNGEDLIAQRMYTVNNPLARIYTQEEDAAWPFTRFDGQEVDNVFETTPDSYVYFRADLIPDYLANDSNTKFTWLIDGVPITDNVIQKNENYQITLDEGNQIGFRAIGQSGNSIKLSARVEREFPQDEKDLLKNSWNLSPQFPSADQVDAEIKIMPPNPNRDPEQETASLRLFLASTVQNAPQFIVFTLRMIIGIALIFTLLWGISSSFSYKK